MAETEEEVVDLAKRLPDTQASLLRWVVGLMADVVVFEDVNKMNSRNISMVFAPNMTQVRCCLTLHLYHVIRKCMIVCYSSHALW